MDDAQQVVIGEYPKAKAYVPQSFHTIESIWRLEKVILDTLDLNEVVQKIVDSVLVELGYLKMGYSIVVLSLVDHDTHTLKRISISQTEEAVRAMKVSPVPFKEIIIPLEEKDNYLIKTITENAPLVTHDWYDILRPSYTREEAQAVQKIVGIKASMLYPITYHGKTEGAMIFSMMKNEDEVTEEEKDFLRSLSDIVGLAVQNARLYTQLEHSSKEMERLNLKLVQANTQLQNLDKMKDEFVSLASHELRTPLTSIRSYIWMVIAGKGGEISEKQLYYLNRAFLSTNRLINMINDMLNISRIESGRLSMHVSRVKLNTLIDEVVAEVKPRIDEQHLKLVIEDMTAIPPVIADSDKIKEVFINIIGNAIKFTPVKGTIRIGCTVEVDRVTISISDSGIGIKEEDIGKLFSKFATLPTEVTNIGTQSTGLGLYICKSIVEMHGGTISMASDGIGKGARCTFTLSIFDPKKREELQKKYATQGLNLIHSPVA